MKVLLPIGNPLKPSQCGLSQRPLQSYDSIDNSTQHHLSLKDSIEEIKVYIRRVKRSNTTVLMTFLNTVLQALIPLDKMKELKGIQIKGFWREWG
jgi:hypothetical protein